MAKTFDLLDEMREHGIEPNMISYNAAISACDKGGQWQRALDLLETMRKGGITPNVISYNAAISACELCGERLRAKNVFLGAIDAYEFVWEKGRNMLDLHSLIAPVARTAVRVALDDVRRRVDDPKSDDDTTLEDMTIITGRGKHSAGNEAGLRPAILAMFHEEYRQLGCQEVESNPGILIVPRASLRRFAASTTVPKKRRRGRGRSKGTM